MAIRIPLKPMEPQGSYTYKISLSNIPVGPQGTTSRTFFRTSGFEPAIGQHVYKTYAVFLPWYGRLLRHIGTWLWRLSVKTEISIEVTHEHHL